MIKLIKILLKLYYATRKGRLFVFLHNFDNIEQIVYSLGE